MPTCEHAPELLQLIAQAMFFNSKDLPVPQLYLRLALVNKSFYQFFMSDAVWKQLDVHDVQENISRHYLRAKKRMGSNEKKLCGGFDFNKWEFPPFSRWDFGRMSLYTRAFIISDSHRLTSRPESYRRLRKKQSDPDLIEFACRSRAALTYASTEHYSNYRFLLHVAEKSAEIVAFATDSLKNDRKLILKALNGSRTALLYCSSELKSDREIVLLHIKRWGNGLEYAAEPLRADLELATAAISKDPHQLQYCAKELKNNHELVLNAVKSDGITIQYASDDLKNEEEIAYAAVASNPLAFEHLGKQPQMTIVKSGIERTVKKRRLADPRETFALGQ